jgi:hypothetical protein
VRNALTTVVETSLALLLLIGMSVAAVAGIGATTGAICDSGLPRDGGEAKSFHSGVPLRGRGATPVSVSVGASQLKQATTVCVEVKSMDIDGDVDDWQDARGEAKSETTQTGRPTGIHSQSRRETEVSPASGTNLATWVVAAFAAASFTSSLLFYLWTRRQRQPRPVIVGGTASHSRADAAVDITLRINNPGEVSIFIQYAVVTECNGLRTTEKPMPSFTFSPQALLPREVGAVTWREPASAFPMCRLLDGESLETIRVALEYSSGTLARGVFHSGSLRARGAGIVPKVRLTSAQWVVRQMGRLKWKMSQLGWKRRKS